MREHHDLNDQLQRLIGRESRLRHDLRRTQEERKDLEVAVKREAQVTSEYLWESLKDATREESLSLIREINELGVMDVRITNDLKIQCSREVESSPGHFTRQRQTIELGWLKGTIRR